MSKQVNISKLIGKGYGKIWHDESTYLAVKGSRASKKSYTISYLIVFNLMKHSELNVLVVRKYFNTHLKSTYQQLLRCIENMGCSHLFKATKNPLEITYLPTNQKILFVGLDDPLKVTSITVNKGFLCWAWIEEAFEITEDEFNKLDLSIRGNFYPLKKKMILTFNPWSDKHWLNKRFFMLTEEEKQEQSVSTYTTNYLINEFLSDEDIKIFENLKKYYPSRYLVEGLGNFGISEGLIFDEGENYCIEAFNLEELMKDKTAKLHLGLDFGYTLDPSAFICCLSIEDSDNLKHLYIYDEHYEKKMTNDDIVNMITSKGYSKEIIYADSAEPKSIDYIKKKGIMRIKATIKGKDSILFGINYLKGFKIHIHPSCKHFIEEIENYIWKKDKFTGDYKQEPEGLNGDHLLDALRYAVTGNIKQKHLQVWK